MMAALATGARRHPPSSGGVAPSALREPRRRFPAILAASAILIAVSAIWPAAAQAYTSESPEVTAMIDKAMAYLEKETDETRLGGRCLIGLAFHKRGLPPTHPKIKAAVDACKLTTVASEDDYFVYSKGLAVIFLAELNASAHAELIRNFAALLEKNKKPHGGYGYIDYQTGDTSQTQYAALAFWEMLNHGLSPDAEDVQKCVGWLIRTQDPDGVWGYQGNDPGSYSLVKQVDRPGLSMAAAAMGSTLILGNTIGLLQPPQQAVVSASDLDALPPALRRVEVHKDQRAPALPAGSVDRQRLAECLDRGRGWFDKNFKIEAAEYQTYYLYSLERYKSFEEYLSGQAEAEPEWYNLGVEHLKKTQREDGSWSDSSGSPCATAFAVLFLLRSTQLSIEASLGEGTLVGGRGLPRDLSKVKLRGGKLVVELKPTELDDLLGMLDEKETDALDALLDNPAALEVGGEVGPEQARRLQQIVRSGPPEARVLAVRALARIRSLDNAPTLIFALTDPDKRVVREARDALKFVSRNFEGFGPPDNFEESGRVQAIDAWKSWYRSVRPDAPPLP